MVTLARYPYKWLLKIRIWNTDVHSFATAILLSSVCVFFLQLFFQNKAIEEEEAFVLFVRKNALQVLIPKYGLEGTVLMSKDSPTEVVFNEEVIENFRFWDENDYEYEIFSQSKIERAQTNVILGGTTWYRRQVTRRFCKNVVVSKQGKNTVEVLAFCDQQKGSSKNKSDWATYTG